jgi:hypothetical protein
LTSICLYQPVAFLFTVSSSPTRHPFRLPPSDAADAHCCPTRRLCLLVQPTLDCGLNSAGCQCGLDPALAQLTPAPYPGATVRCFPMRNSRPRVKLGARVAITHAYPSAESCWKACLAKPTPGIDRMLPLYCGADKTTAALRTAACSWEPRDDRAGLKALVRGHLSMPRIAR